MNMKYYIGLDIGTSAVKGALTDETTRVVATASAGFVYIEKGTGKFLEPEKFVDTCMSVIGELAGKAAEDCEKAGDRTAKPDIASVCSCCASGDPLFLDGDMKPLTPIIGWQTRVDWDILDRVYTKEEQDALYRIVGWDFFDGMPAANLAWLREKRPDILRATRFMCMSAEYLNYKLTGRWGIAHSMGTPSYLIDQEKGVYNAAMLDKFGLTEEMLPPIYNKGTVLGPVKPETAQKLGLYGNTQVVLGTFDHPSGALGAGVLEEGEMLLSCGTSWVELFPLATREAGLATGGLVDRFLLKGAPYCVMKSMSSVSDKMNERRSRLLGEISHRRFDELIEASQPGSGGLRFDFTPEDYERAKGFSQPDIARAIIESAALKLKENLVELKKFGLRADKITAIGGITNSPVCVRIISEILGQEVGVVNGQAAGAVGSCLLGGIGTGLFASEKDAVERMRSRLKAQSSALDRARKAYEIESECIREMADFFDPDAYMRAVMLLKNAVRIGVSGCGHSGIMCQHFAHLMCCIEQPAKFILPSEAIHGGTGFLKAGDVCVLASRGGKTAELIPILDICRAKGVRIITITENMDSPLAKGADVVLKQHVNRETDKYNCQGTTSSTALAVIFHVLQTMLIEETDFKNEQFAVIHPGGAVGERLNKMENGKL